MLITTALLLVAMLAVFAPLRNGWFMLHALPMLGLGFWLKGQYAYPPLGKDAVVLAILVHVVLIQVTTFILYYMDKQRAKKARRRVPEKTLHAFAFVGGTVAALIGQRVFRHKTKKKSFRNKFIAVMIVQVALLFLAAIVLLPE